MAVNIFVHYFLLVFVVYLPSCMVAMTVDLDPAHTPIGGIAGVGGIREGVHKINGITHCGGILNGTHGYFHTPNFPDEFPYPISCKWLLYAPPGKKIVLHLTQYFLRTSLHISEYEFYKNESFYVGRNDLSDLHLVQLTYVSIEKPYMLLKFQVNDIQNIHLRADEYLLEVFGFNMTYEIIDITETIRLDTCSVAKCSYLGDCLVSKNFESYDCHCFGEHYGKYCQYGPFCDPYRWYGGMNMCKNGGRCRYFMGSLVNTCDCPPMYGGLQCTVKKEGYVQTECKELGCSQLCVKQNDTTTVCACHEGFRLRPNGKDCIEKGKRRYYAEIRLDFQEYFETFHRFPNCSSITDTFTMDISAYLKLALQEFTNFTVISSYYIDGYLYVEFTFMGEKTEQVQTHSSLWKFLTLTRICDVNMDAEYLVFDSQPALHGLSIENPEKKPTVEGKLLTVVCKVKGSEQLQFSWSKDGSPVDVTRTSRNMWETRIPSHDGETRISVLSVEKAYYLDEGLYTCAVTDWGETESQSIHISLDPIPHMEVSPLAVTVDKGWAAIFNCFSRDEIKRAQYKYDWLRDGQPLRERLNKEVIEDLYPTGSRLSIGSSNIAARYTCQITSASGTTQQDSVLQLIFDESQICQFDPLDGIVWQETPGGGQDLQKCPREAKGFSWCESRTCRKLTWSTGSVSRRCVCLEGKCTWEKPNFSQCHTIAMDVIQQKMFTLLHGFQAYKVMDIVSQLELYQQYQLEQLPLFAGDIEMQAKMITDIQAYAAKYLSIEAKTEATQHILGVTAKLMDIALTMTEEEKQDMHLYEYQMEFTKTLAKDPHMTYLAQNDTYTIETKDVGLHVSVLAPPRETDQKSKRSLHRKSVTHHHEHVDVHIQRVLGDENENTSLTFITAVHKRMFDFIPKNINGPQEFYINSEPVLLDLENTDMFFPWVTKTPVTMMFKLKKPVVHNMNVSLCAVWTSDEFPEGEWTPDACHIAFSNRTHTSCTCFWPGHYVVISRDNVQHEMQTKSIALDLIQEHMGLFIALLLSILIYIVCIILHVVYWRMMKKEWRFIRSCFTVLLMGLTVTILFGITRTDQKLGCLIAKLCTFFLYECFISFLFVESLRLYLHSIDFGMFRKNTMYKSKDLLLAIGLSLVSLTLTIIIGVSIGYNQHSDDFCWIRNTEWEMFTFCIPTVIIMLGFYLLVIIACIRMVRYGTKMEEKSKASFKFYSIRSMIIGAIVIFQITCSLLMMEPARETLYENLFAASHVLLAVVWLLLFRQVNVSYMKCYLKKLPCSPHMSQWWQSFLYGIQSVHILCTQSSGKSKDFKTIIRTQTPPGQLAPNMQEAEDARKRDKKYTSEVKEQLSLLLGSSASSSDGSKPSKESSKLSHSAIPPVNKHKPLDPDCSCRICIRQFVIKPIRCPSFIKEPSDVMVRPRPFTRSHSMPDSSAIDTSWAQRRKSIPNPFPELERGKSYITESERSSFVEKQVDPDDSKRIVSQPLQHEWINSCKYRPEYHRYLQRHHSTSSESSSCSRTNPRNINIPLRDLNSRPGSGYQSPRKKSRDNKPNVVFKETDDHSSSVLSDDEMSDENTCLNSKRRRSSTPSPMKVTFVGIDSEDEVFSKQNGEVLSNPNEEDEEYLQMSQVPSTAIC